MIKLKDILREYVPSDPANLAKALKDIQSLGYPNPLNSREIVIDNSVVIEISVFDKRLWFSSIHSIDKGQGNAGRVMQKIVDIADKYGVTIALTPKPFGTSTDKLNKSQLVAFYKKYGFKPEKGGFGDMERVANKLNEAKETKEEKDFEEFADTRMSGAEKIVDNAKEKGGLALLTWHHFKVKLPYYEKATKGKLDVAKAREEYITLLDQLYKSTIKDMAIEQVAFQELVGKIEVLGELIIKHQ
jgi:hypothetical protein